MDNIKEGALHKVVEIEGVTFEIYLGYSTEEEKKQGWEPSPQYPVFEKHPQYTKDGRPFAIVYQDCCEYYESINPNRDNLWCYNCKLFDKREDYIGICTCEHRRAVARSGTQPPPAIAGNGGNQDEI